MGTITLNPDRAGRAEKIKPAYLRYSFFIKATLISRHALGRTKLHPPVTLCEETE
jgi:hypothetical protein